MKFCSQLCSNAAQLPAKFHSNLIVYATAVGPLVIQTKATKSYYPGSDGPFAAEVKMDYLWSE